MTVKETKQDEYIKKETFLWAMTGCLIVGFLGGVVFASFQLPGTMPAPVAQAPQTDQAGEISPAIARMIESLEKEVAAFPSNVGAWIQLGNTYFGVNEFEKAIVSYKNALELNPENAGVWSDMGVMYRRSGNPQQAIASFDQAMAVDPAHETSRFNKGIVLMYDLGEQQAAVKIWEELVNLNPNAVAHTGEPLAKIIEQLKAEIMTPEQ